MNKSKVVVITGAFSGIGEAYSCFSHYPVYVRRKLPPCNSVRYRRSAQGGIAI